MRTTSLPLVLGLFASTGVSNEVSSGFNAFKAAQVMVDKAGQSWEWGTAAEALLELYNPELAVYSNNAFPGGKIPNADPNTFSLKYARQFINTNSQVFVGNSAVGDPASLGVSAILLGQSDQKYIDASNREAGYLLNDAPKYSNGAISHRPDVAELWADNVAMSFPFLAYLAVQQNDVSLMTKTVQQISLYRDVLKAGDLNWRHIIGPQSQDTGLWSSGNGWAVLGMTRVLHTLQRWPASSAALGSQAGQLKSWIKEIFDGAMQSNTDNGLLRNYINDGSWFGEISGTSLISAMVYRMAVNDPAMFGADYIAWADKNRKTVASKQGNDGVFSPAINPYDWHDHTQYTSGSPEGQAFTVMLYTAYRDCINAGVCQDAPSATTISKPGIGPIDILTVLNAPLQFSAMPDPTGTVCGAFGSCDAPGCAGKFMGETVHPVCSTGSQQGCQCAPSSATCGPPQSCDAGGCSGSFNGLGNVKYAKCTKNFVTCDCLPQADTCGDPVSCDKNDCKGSFNGLGNVKYAKCTNNFIGCDCLPQADTYGDPVSCDKNDCKGSFNGLGNVKYAKCTNNFIGCDCLPQADTCGNPVSCDKNDCKGSFNGLGNVKYAKCTDNFIRCDYLPQPDTCGPPKSYDDNDCKGSFNGLGNVKYGKCTINFIGYDCIPTPSTCGSPKSCDANDCKGSFNGLGNVRYTKCTNNFIGCDCMPQPDTCGPPQSCDKSGCNGKLNSSNGNSFCTGNFVGCQYNGPLPPPPQPTQPQIPENPGGTDLIIDSGCVLVNGSPHCNANAGRISAIYQSFYHVNADQGDYSTATILASFDESQWYAPMLPPGCQLNARWPRNYGQVFFGADNCLYDASNNRIDGQCCDTPDSSHNGAQVNPWRDPRPAGSCKRTPGFGFVHFEISIKGWVPNGDPSSLWQQLGGCGALTLKRFGTNNDVQVDGSNASIGYYEAEYLLMFNIDILFKDGCVGRAMVSAGAPPGRYC